MSPDELLSPACKEKKPKESWGEVPVAQIRKEWELRRKGSKTMSEAEIGGVMKIKTSKVMLGGEILWQLSRGLHEESNEDLQDAQPKDCLF